MDIEFSEVAGAYRYEIEIVANTGAKFRLEVPAPAYRAEWYGTPGLYRIQSPHDQLRRVRQLVC